MSDASYDDLKAPTLSSLPFDMARAVTEASTLPAASLLLSMAPNGDGHPVVVCPPFLADDASTTFLRQYLKSKNYYVYGWKLGFNLGPQVIGDGSELLAKRVIEIHKKLNRKVSLVGWSLGGVMARELAKVIPDHVRQVITLGSPISGNTDGVNTNVRWALKQISGYEEDSEEWLQLVHDIHLPPSGVPSTSVFSKSDGVVSWQICKEYPSDFTDNIEIYGSHMGMGINPAVYFAVADRLSLPENEWSPFDRTASFWRRAMFPSSGHHVNGKTTPTPEEKSPKKAKPTKKTKATNGAKQT